MQRRSAGMAHSAPFQTQLACSSAASASRSRTVVHAGVGVR